MKKRRKSPWLAYFIVLVVTSACSYSGDRIARELISLSKEGTVAVSMNALGEEVCVLPDGAADYAEYYFKEVKRFRYDRDPYFFSGRGYWSIAIRKTKTSEEVFVYAIDKRIVDWDVPSNSPMNPFIVCNSDIQIRKMDDRYYIPVAIGK